MTGYFFLICSALSSSGPRCVARFGFEGKHSDELSLCEGDVIRLKEFVDQQWARGDLNGHVGIFPLNFVEIVEDLPSAALQPGGQTTPGRSPKTVPEHHARRTLYENIQFYADILAHQKELISIFGCQSVVFKTFHVSKCCSYHPCVCGHFSSLAHHSAAAEFDS